MNNDMNSDKTKGWWFSVFFMLLVVGLILFLSFFKIVDENRDILIGVIGVLTGSISSMLTIASGRSPEEIEELKASDPFNRILDKIVIKDALLKLKDKQREAIELYFFEEYTQEEAAELLKITQASFSRRLERALESLKKLLEEEIV